MQTFSYEYTDAFDLSPNYSWVQRGTVTVPDNASDMLIMRKVKAELGLSGVRGERVVFGETITFRPYGSCTVLFINYCED